MVAVKFPRSTGQTGVRSKWGAEGKDALHLGSTKMEGVGHSPSSPGCQGGKTGRGGGSWGEKEEGEALGIVWTIETSTRGRQGVEDQMICSFTDGHLLSQAQAPE